jgi:hypothetical protein
LGDAVRKSAEESKDGMPDFKKLLLTAVPTFDTMPETEQRKYIEGIKDGMIQGVKDRFAADVADLPDFIRDMLLYGLEMGLDAMERSEREQWNQGHQGQYQGQGGHGQTHTQEPGMGGMMPDFDNMPDFIQMMQQLGESLK